MERTGPLRASWAALLSLKEAFFNDHLGQRGSTNHSRATHNEGTDEDGFMPAHMQGEHRVTMRSVLDLGATTLSNVGFPTAPTASAITLTNRDSGNGRLLGMATSAVSGNNGYIHHDDFVEFRMQPYVSGKFRSGTATSVRYWWGLFDGDPRLTAAPAASLEQASFAWDTGVYSGNWRCITSDGATATVTDSGVAMSNNTRVTFRIECDTEGAFDEVRFYIDDSLVATHTGSNIPASSTVLQHWASLTTLTAGIREARATGLHATSQA